MTQQTLPVGGTAASALAISAQYDWRFGWSFRLSWRASGQPGFEHRDYEALSGAELVDVLSSELERIVMGGQASPSGGGAGAA